MSTTRDVLARLVISAQGAMDAISPIVVLNSIRGGGYDPLGDRRPTVDAFWAVMNEARELLASEAREPVASGDAP